MTGWKSKKESSNVRWLGPYAPTDRHADEVTLEELIRLRVENEELKRELDEALKCGCFKREKQLEQMFAYFEDPYGQEKDKEK